MEGFHTLFPIRASVHQTQNATLSSWTSREWFMPAYDRIAFTGSALRLLLLSLLLELSPEWRGRLNATIDPCVFVRGHDASDSASRTLSFRNASYSLGIQHLHGLRQQIDRHLTPDLPARCRYPQWPHPSICPTRPFPIPRLSSSTFWLSGPSPLNSPSVSNQAKMRSIHCRVNSSSSSLKWR
jgi:hypothetical protein